MDMGQHEVVKEGFWQRHSPRQVLLFSLSWLVLMTIALPMALIHLLPPLLNPEWTDWFTILLVVGLGIGLALPFFAGLVLLFRALHEIIRSHFSTKWPLLALLVVIFYSYLGAALAVTPVLIKQKRYWFAAAGLASLGCFLTVLLLRFGGLGLAVTPSVIRGLAAIGVFALIAAAGGCRDRRPLHPSCLWPLALAGVFWVGLHAYRVKLDRDLHQGRQELSKLVGHSVELRDFLARGRRGLSLAKEPLKTLIAAKPDSQAPDFTTASRSEHLAYVEKLRSEAPDFVAAAEALVKMPVMGIRHDDPEDWMADSKLPELAAFRQAARYCGSDLVARCDDRDLVLSRCADLERLRDWSLSKSTLTAKLVAMAIEKMYLQALARPLAAGTLTDDDWRLLLARKPDWGRALALAFGDEAASFQHTIEHMLQGDDGQKEAVGADAENALLLGRMLEPLFPRSAFEIMVRRDYRFALDWFKNLRYFLDAQGLTAKERADLVALDRTSRVRLGGPPRLFFAMLMPALSRIHLKHGEIEDQRQAVAIGVAAAAFRRQQGRWPESLAFLPEEPLDAVNGLPFQCEQGQLKARDGHDDSKVINGFRVYARNADGQDPGGAKAAVAFTIIDY